MFFAHTISSYQKNVGYQNLLLSGLHKFNSEFHLHVFVYTHTTLPVSMYKNEQYRTACTEGPA